MLGSLDPTSDRAVFRQIADRLREAIDQGSFPEGAKLPSESELVEHFGVSRMTVRNALSMLQSEGLVSSEHGRGVFVRPRPPVRRLASDRFARRHREQGKSAFIVEADAAGSRPEVDNLEVKEERPTADVSARLGAPRRVPARRRRYLLDGRPVEFAVSYLPLDLARDTPTAQPNPGPGPGGIYARLEELGHHLDHIEEEIRAGMPSPQEVKTLQLASGVPVIHLIRTAFDTKAAPWRLRQRHGRRHLRAELPAARNVTAGRARDADEPSGGGTHFSELEHTNPHTRIDERASGSRLIRGPVRR